MIYGDLSSFERQFRWEPSASSRGSGLQSQADKAVHYLREWAFALDFRAGAKAHIKVETCFPERCSALTLRMVVR